MGARLVVAVDAAAVGKDLAVNLELLSEQGEQLEQQSMVVALEADAHAFQVELQLFTAAVKRHGSSPPAAQAQPPAKEATPATPPAAVAEASSSWRSRAWIPAVAGGALLAGGGVLFGLSKAAASSLTQPGLPDPHAVASLGSTEQTTGVALMAAGLAGLAVAGGFYALGGSDPQAPAVTLAPGPGSFFVGVRGSFR